ncbi:TetR/AcrR family transcriptional regulator [Aquihabitans sp. G128]|uniref:TetR/AcrR family transcriptional regulator n=1 Tax=Aquihabitans sp. G128 TaxID=2849779 RepID=UPI001C24E78B|nr:TetR/AcrR family transcriptional regulator [Aquihabitans sp. G128]QXC60901.1 TetR/AcrR family transcriptional regulator [Aquihabitans sp. G128]
MGSVDGGGSGGVVAPTRRPRDRKAQIVDAAAELFARNGFGAVGIDEIGAAVGVTGPAIYRHFRSKDALLATIIEQSVALVDEVTRQAFDDDGADDDGGGEAGRERDDRDGHLHRAVVATIGAVLGQPALLGTYLRERPALGAEAAAPFVPAERAIRRRWQAAMGHAHPDVDGARAGLRQDAVIGAVNAAALARRDLAEAPLTALLADSAMAVIAAPVRAATPEPERAWSVPRSRRQEILRAALDLFEHRGFGGVGMDEIGEAAGTSGPAIYRQYDSKADILVDAFEEAGQRVAVGVDEALRESGSAADALGRLARSYATVALESTALITVTEREGLSLPDAERPRIERRARAIRDGWAAVATELRPDLAPVEVRLLVRTAFPLVNGAARGSRRRWAADELAGAAEAWILGDQK